jgi:hypothetical protein
MTTIRAVQRAKEPEIQFRRKLLAGEIDSYATVLVGILGDHFNSLEWFDWEPDTLIETVREELKLDMPLHVRDRIWGLVTALSTDQFYRDPLVFNHVCNALSGGPVPLGVFEPAEVDEVAWGVLEVLMSDLDENQDPKFSVDVATYVGVTLHEAGLDRFPPLEFAITPGTPAIPDAQDPAMVAAWTEGRVALKEEILGDLEQGVRELHKHLQLAGLVSDRAQ